MTPEENAALIIRTQYVKDLSFESPNPLKAFTTVSETQPNIAVNIQVQANNIGDNNFEVVIELNAEAKRDKEVMFVAELSYGCIASIGNVPEEQVGPLLMIECPHLMFPFARNILSDVTREGGFPPLYISPIDFGALYTQRNQQPAENGVLTSA